MTTFRMTYAGEIKKAETKQVNGKDLVEVSLCRKQKGRNGAEDSFAWLRVSLWEPASFMAPRLVKGGFIAGSGEFSVRTYEKDGQVKYSLECRSNSFDVEVWAPSGEHKDSPLEPTPVPARSTHRTAAPAVIADDVSEPPFLPDRTSF